MAGSRPPPQVLPGPESPRSFGGIENLLWYLSPDIPLTPVSWRRLSNGAAGSPFETTARSPLTRPYMVHAQEKGWPGWCDERLGQCPSNGQRVPPSEPPSTTGRWRQSQQSQQVARLQHTRPRSLDDALRRAAGTERPNAQSFHGVAPSNAPVQDQRASFTNGSGRLSAGTSDEAANPYTAHPDVDIGVLMTNPSFLLKHFHPCNHRMGYPGADDIAVNENEASSHGTPHSSSRYARSIGFLTAHLLGLFAPQADGRATYAERQTCASLATALNVAPRRIYDVISVLEAIGILERDARGGQHKTLSMQVRLRSLTPTRLLSVHTGARAQRAQLERRIEDLEKIREELDNDLRNLRARLRDLLRQLIYRPGSTKSIAQETATLLATEIDGRHQQHQCRQTRWFMLRPSADALLTGFWTDPATAATSDPSPDVRRAALPRWRIDVPGQAQLVPVADIEATTPVSTALESKAAPRRSHPLRPLDPNRVATRMPSSKRYRAG
ncbi:hypothetical protein CCYA_CCYA12G3256 [Cyanidiococcus yangmingshanensis]|nr:hypothetical protein CCYA_CCYA12G3256 [Cyanidiococcus yangmingshanensis]